MTRATPSPAWRKAAIVLASVDAAAADALLRQLPAEQSEQLRAALAHLGDFDTIEQADVAAEFLAFRPADLEQNDAGVELDPQLSHQFELGDDVAATETEEPASADLPATLISFKIPASASSENADSTLRSLLRDTAPEDLARFLASEHPQTAALVVSQLSHERAAEVIAALPASMQADVVRRLVDRDETNPDVLREVARELERRIAAQASLEQRRAAGLSTVNHILAAAGQQTGQQIRRNVAQHNVALADRLASRPLQFAELIDWNDAALQTLFAAAEPEWVLLAVAGASPALAERIVKLLSPAEAIEFRQALAELGPTPLSDLKEAQQRIALLAKRLELAGELSGAASVATGVRT